MRKNSSLTDYCETAAFRVQYWFGRDKGHLLATQNAGLIGPDFCKKYKCNLLKPPRIICPIERLPLQTSLQLKDKKQIKPRQVTKGNPLKQLQISIDRSCCTISQTNYCYPLSPSRVVSYKFREHYIVSKKLKTFSKTVYGGNKKHQMVPIKSSSSKDSSEVSFLQEWEKRNEERHYHIGRVIKYLMD